MTPEQQRADIAADLADIEAVVHAEHAGTPAPATSVRLAEEIRTNAMPCPLRSLSYTMVKRVFEDPFIVDQLVDEIHEAVRRDGSLEMLITATQLTQSIRRIAAHQAVQAPA